MDQTSAADSLLVVNKIDLLTGEACDAVTPSNIDIVRTSAVTGAGIAELIQSIASKLVPHAPPAGAAVPFTQEQVAALRRARDAVEAGNAGNAEEALASFGS